MQETAPDHRPRAEPAVGRGPHRAGEGAVPAAGRLRTPGGRGALPAAAAGPLAGASILAASRGSALGELTEQRPKTMVEVRGQPLLSHIVSAYNAAGIKRINVVRGYLRAGDRPAGAHLRRQRRLRRHRRAGVAGAGPRGRSADDCGGSLSSPTATSSSSATSSTPLAEPATTTSRSSSTPTGANRSTAGAPPTT